MILLVGSSLVDVEIIEKIIKQNYTNSRGGCFPTNLSTIELSYDNENQIEEFTVELQVQYWESGTTS